jgi:hypothetical protein
MSSVAATQPSFLGAGSGMLPFDLPFVYDPAQGSLLVDFDVASQPATTWSIQSAASAPGTARHSDIGTACGGLLLSSTGGGNTYNLTYTLTGGPANAQGVFLFGATLFPVPIPLPGSPGCNVHQNPILALPIALDGAGGYSLPLTYAANPSLRGFTLFGQVGALNPTSGLVVSQTRAATLTDAHDGARMYVLGSNTTPTGTLQLGSMIVIRFQN